jgi:hypothetical protein
MYFILRHCDSFRKEADYTLGPYKEAVSREQNYVDSLKITKKNLSQDNRFQVY